MEFGEMIRKARLEKGLSQAMLGKAVELHRSTIMSYEKHGKMPKDARTWRMLEEVLDLDLSQFFRESRELDRFMGMCSRNYGLHNREIQIDFSELRRDLHSENERQLRYWETMLEFVAEAGGLTKECVAEIDLTQEEIRKIRKRREMRAWQKQHDKQEKRRQPVPIYQRGGGKI